MLPVPELRKADALLDDGHGDAALQYLEQQSQTIVAHGGEIYDGVPDMRISILLALGRAQDALALVEQRERDAAREGAEWANCSQPRRLQKARALALLQRDDEAMQALLPWREVARATACTGCVQWRCWCRVRPSAIAGIWAAACS